MQRLLCIGSAVLVIGLATESVGGSLKSDRTSLLSNQMRILDQRLRQKGNRVVDVMPAQVYTPSMANSSLPKNGAFVLAARQAAAKHGIPERIFFRLISQESNWHAEARSPKGAIGLTQIMPQTAKELGIDPFDPVENLEGGARYLRAQFKEFGSWRLALAAYNAGPGAVKKHKGVPPFEETRTYVRKILDLPS